MRIRTLISGSLALAAMLFAQSCGDKNEPEGLPEINLSKNVIEFQQEAGVFRDYKGCIYKRVVPEQLP